MKKATPSKIPSPFSHGAKKSLGQNFLMHAQTAERIADAAGLTPEDTVLEIGPGTGMLTRALLARARRVIAVETDGELAAQLRKTFITEIFAGRLELIEGDIRAFDAASIHGEYKLVANIPYYITGEIIRQFLTVTHQPSSMTLLVQKEVAERIVTRKSAGGGKESLLSLSVKAYGVPKYCFMVPRGAFFPAPNVDSAVLSIENIDRSSFSDVSEEAFFKILHAGFAHKRKQLFGNLTGIASETALQEALAAAAISPKARAEDVPLDSWLVLTKALSTEIS